MSTGSYHALETELYDTNNSPDYMKHVMDSINDAVVVTDLNENIIFLNTMAEKLSGSKTADVTGKHFNSIFTLKKARSGDTLVYDFTKLTDHTPSMELHKNAILLLQDGSQCYISDCSSIIKDSHNRHLGFSIVLRDVSSKYLLEKKAYKSRERMNALLEAGNVSSWTYYLHNNTVSVSAHFLESLGYTKHQPTVPMKSVLSKIHPNDLSRVNSIIDNFLSGEVSNNYVEARILSVKKEWIWFYAKTSILNHNDQDKAFSITGIFVNIDKVKQTQFKLHESYQKLDKTTSLAKIGYFEIDLKNREFVNFETISRLFNVITEAKMSSDSFFSSFVHPDYINIAKDHFMDFILRLKEYLIEFPIIANKKVYWTKVLIVCDPDRENYAFGIMQDISAIKKNEKALQIAKRRAEESDKLKSAFLANMSHEIRTPLNSIVGFSHLLVDGRYTQDQCSDFADQITSGTKSLLEVVEDILDISKIESGNYEFYYDYIDLHLLFEELERICNLDISPNLMLKFDRHSPFLHFNTDRLRLRQTMMCLLKNAIKFTVKGNICFGYSISEDNKHIHIFVNDDGPGIPADKQDLVFHRFIKLSPNSTGTGLGLSISKAIVENLGGEIQLQSRSPKGCKFIITLPVKDSLISEISY